jgi:endonuclease YncB( thermonuclease family)
MKPLDPLHLAQAMSLCRPIWTYGAVLLGLALVPNPGSSAPEVLPGPIHAQVVRVVDGDTVEVDAQIWLGQKVRTLVRLNGIDAPELNGACAQEHALAQSARSHLADRLAGGTAELVDVTYDKFGGRVLARILAPDGTDLAQSLLAAGLARAYQGGRRLTWCATG